MFSDISVKAKTVELIQEEQILTLKDVKNEDDYENRYNSINK